MNSSSPHRSTQSLGTAAPKLNTSNLTLGSSALKLSDSNYAISSSVPANSMLNASWNGLGVPVLNGIGARVLNGYGSPALRRVKHTGSTYTVSSSTQKVPNGSNHTLNTLRLGSNNTLGSSVVGRRSTHSPSVESVFGSRRALHLAEYGSVLNLGSVYGSGQVLSVEEVTEELTAPSRL